MIGATAIKPVERKGFEAFSWFLYDKDTGAVMGRTLESWLKITVFYIIYYTFLAGFWLIMIFVFFTFIEDDKPMWTTSKGLIGSSPALGVRPKQDDKMIDSSMIIFRKDIAEMKDPKKDVVPGFGGWVNRTNDFLKSYANPPGNAIDCNDPEAVKNRKWGKDFCKFDVKDLSGCKYDATNPSNYGYDEGAPCLIIKLNRIYDLIPTFYNGSDQLPPETIDPEEKCNDGECMPAEARQKIIERMKLTDNKNQVWLHCEGENAADKENLGEIEYFPPHAGFPDTYFPYLNEKGYQNPLVAVKLKNPEEGKLIHLECRAYAGNIKYHRRDRRGIVHMEIMVHTAKTAKAVDDTYNGKINPPVKPRKAKPSSQAQPSGQ